MRNVLLLKVLLLLYTITLAQKAPRRKAAKTTAFQGICGVVVEKKGNHMPSPGKPVSGGQPVEREVLIYPLLNLSQVEAGDNGFITSVGEAKPLKTIKSGKDGKFCVAMPVGRYTLIVREPEGLYANLSDTKNNIFPVNVQKNNRADIRFEISHQATF